MKAESPRLDRNEDKAEKQSECENEENETNLSDRVIAQKGLRLAKWVSIVSKTNSGHQLTCSTLYHFSIFNGLLINPYTLSQGIYSMRLTLGLVACD
ncbi:MAG: hypothetical protein WEC59_07935 [Salibacteraceae bacterium]